MSQRNRLTAIPAQEQGVSPQDAGLPLNVWARPEQGELVQGHKSNSHGHGFYLRETM